MEPFTDTPALPMDALMSSMRAQLVQQVKGEIEGDILDRVIRLVGSHLRDMQINVTPQVTAAPASVHVNPSTAVVDVELDMEDMCACLNRIESMLKELIGVLKSPVRRTVQRDSDNLITTVVEGRM